MTKHKQPIKMRAYVSIIIYDFAKEIDRNAHRFRCCLSAVWGGGKGEHLPKTKENKTKKIRG